MVANYLILGLLACTAWGAAAAEQENFESLEVFGWVERVELLDGKFNMKAKLDTGAATSSLDATDIQRFRRDGRRWVRFTVIDDEEKPHVFEKPLVRNVRIVRHDGEFQRRAVVKMPVCLGRHYRVVEFNLIDRSNFIYPVLLGRSALANVGLVDSGSTFTNYPSCTAEAESG